jgi:serine/threonine-protein kinase HipA
MKSEVSRPMVLEVRLGQTLVGTVTHLPNDLNLFLFDEAYVNDGNRPVLSQYYYDVSGALRTKGEQAQTKVPPFFSNLLPEGPLRTYLANLGRIHEEREFFFLWLLGQDLPGNVIIRDIDGRATPPTIEPPPGEKTSARNSDRLLRFSLAGVQLKFSAVGGPKGLTIPTQGMGGHWIVKLPSMKYPHVPENEYSMMEFARRVGIDVPRCGLMPIHLISGLPSEWSANTENAYYIERFDRTPDGGRVHIEDFNQVYGQYPHDKYEKQSYTMMAKAIWRFLDEDALKEFVRRLIFNAGIGNSDMHLKNWSIIYPDGRTPKLSPAYDFVSTVVCMPGDKKMALSIAKQKSTELLDKDLLKSFIRRAEVPSAHVMDTAIQTAESMVDLWPKIRDSLPLNDAAKKIISAQMESVPFLRDYMQGVDSKEAAHR